MQEINYFEFFKRNQLHSVCFVTGTINVYVRTGNKSGSVSRYVRKDVGSLNEDGYQRFWCGTTTDLNYKPKLFMKHRFLYWLKHNTLGTKEKQIDHIDRDRNNNSISNLRLVTKIENMQNMVPTSKRATYPLADILYVCHLLETTSLSDLTIAGKVGLSRNYVRDIKKRRRQFNNSTQFTWTHRE